MTIDGENTVKNYNETEKAPNHKDSSIYLWQGFSGNLSLTTFDLFMEINVKDIAFGDNHSLFLTEDGQVYVNGKNDMGQLGLGSLDVNIIEEPTKLKGLSDIVTQISCGRHHSAIVTNTGQVFCWGSSKDGQCGTGSLDVILTPTQVVVEANNEFCQHGVQKSTISEFLISIACGGSHTLAVSRVGEVWAWGSGPQVGLGDLKHTPVPCKIDTLHARRVVAICCGERHSMALVLRDKKRTSRSSSPWKSKGKLEDMPSIKNDNLSQCDICNKEIFTYTDTNDICIIDKVHDCNVSNTIDATLVEDLYSSSSSSEASKISATVSPQEKNKCMQATVQEIKDLLPNEEMDCKSNGNLEYDGLLNDSNQLNTNESTSHKQPDKSDSNSNEHDHLARDRTLSVESDGEVWKRRSFSEELQVFGPGNNDQPTVTTCIKSLDLSGAREYLERQFEDEKNMTQSTSVSDQRPGTFGRKPLTVIEGSQSGKIPASPDCAVGDISSLLTQVKPVTSKPLTSTQASSAFSSSDLDEGKNFLNHHSSIELSSLPGSGKDHIHQNIEEDSRQKVMRSGTFIEWTREMAAVDDDPASLIKDSDQQSLRTIEMKQKNLTRASLSSKSDVSNSRSSHTHEVTATDVWVWGCNDHGQLGLGDQLERAQPTIIKLFMGRHVIKLAAGKKHSLALTENSQIYSWGSNKYGQLGQPDGVSGPSRIKFMKGFTAWDICAGSAHSVFLGDSLDMHPDVLYCGKNTSKGVQSSVRKTNLPVSLAEVKKHHWITRVMAGGPQSACKVLEPLPPESESVFELASSERRFYNQLIKTSNLLLRPLQRSKFSKSLDVYPFKNSLQNLVVNFGILTKKIGEGITDLTRCIQNSAPLNHSLILGSRLEFMEAFRIYSHSFSDFLAVGGFDYCTRIGGEFFEKIQGSIKDLSDEQEKSVTASNLFLGAMRYPFFRLAEYSRIITRISVLVASLETKTWLQSIVLDWDGLKISFSSEHKMADTTRLFWETAVPKLTEALRTPDRRMLRDSKTSPLQMPSGGKFTSRQFVLFNDIFLMQSINMTIFPLETLWLESVTCGEEQDNAIIIIAPEERLKVLASTPAQKAEWLIALNSAISKVLTNQKSILSKHDSGEWFTPPLIRHACHTFVKAGHFKDAVYDGTWLSGKVHGIGTLKWPNGSLFQGHFQGGLLHGSGTFTIIKNKAKEVQKGIWKNGKLNGPAIVNYANGDLYEGYFQDGQRFGHGMFQSGHHKSSYASVYIGEWSQNLREGYGVQDDILKGEKYMGMWVEDHCHGNGVLVTLDGMYFEGNFVQNKLVGFGLMISDDNSLYEGDFMDIGHLSGKGTLTLCTGDRFDGSFTGTLNMGLKVNGTFIKSSSPEIEQKSHSAKVQSKYFGRLGVNSDAKWTDAFSHICSVLGKPDLGTLQSREETNKAWDVVAVSVTAGRNALKSETGMSPIKIRVQERILESLEKIPAQSVSSLNTLTVEEMSRYLSQACDCIYHPLGHLMEMLVNAFRASYIGIGAHPRLLHHAVLEVKSYIRRLYRVVRILFPVLPAKGGPIYVYPPSRKGEFPQSTDEVKGFVEGLESEDPNVIILTASSLLLPILLPKIYPALFDLYALYNEKSDDHYWEHVSRLNRQSDFGLMAFLGIDQRYWLVEDILEQDNTQKLSTVKDVCYVEAVDTLQQLSTEFSPIEKLKIIEQTFNQITKTVTLALKDDHMWCMDDLFPIFQFVVVRAKIHHLGAEIHMVDDLIEPHLEHGELGLMFTTLKGCYFQIQNEKMPHP